MHFQRQGCPCHTAPRIQSPGSAGDIWLLKLHWARSREQSHQPSPGRSRRAHRSEAAADWISECYVIKNGSTFYFNSRSGRFSLHPWGIGVCSSVKIRFATSCQDEESITDTLPSPLVMSALVSGYCWVPCICGWTACDAFWRNLSQWWGG